MVLLGQGNHGASSRGKWTMTGTLKTAQVWDGSESFFEGIYRHYSLLLSWGGFPFKTLHLMGMWTFCELANRKEFHSIRFWVIKNREYILIAILQTHRAQEAVSLPRMVPYIWNKFTFSKLRIPMYKTWMPLNYVAVEIQQYGSCTRMPFGQPIFPRGKRYKIQIMNKKRVSTHGIRKLVPLHDSKLQF